MPMFLIDIVIPVNVQTMDNRRYTVLKNYRRHALEREMYSEMINKQQAGEAGIREFVMKPYVITNLAKKIRKVFEEK
jgi:hypothetical protein